MRFFSSYSRTMRNWLIGLFWVVAVNARAELELQMCRAFLQQPVSFEAMDRRLMLSRLLPKVTLSFRYSPGDLFPSQYAVNAQEPLTVSDTIFENLLFEYLDHGDQHIRPGEQTDANGVRQALFLTLTWELDGFIFGWNELWRARMDVDAGIERLLNNSLIKSDEKSRQKKPSSLEIAMRDAKEEALLVWRCGSEVTIAQ